MSDLLPIASQGIVAIAFAMLWWQNRREKFLTYWTVSYLATFAAVVFGYFYEQDPQTALGVLSVLSISFGSAFLWAGVRAYQRQNDALRTVILVGCALFLVTSGIAFLASLWLGRFVAAWPMAAVFLWAGYVFIAKGSHSVERLTGTLLVTRGLILLLRPFHESFLWIPSINLVVSVSLALTMMLTALARISHQLQSSRSSWVKTLDLIPDAILVLEAGTKEILWINHAFERLFCVTKKQLLGKTDLSIGFWENPDDRNHVNDCLDSSPERAVSYDAVFRQHGGGSLVCQGTADKVLFDESPADLHVIRDVTQEREIAQKLERSATRFRRLYENMLEGFVTVDDEERISDFNEAFRSMLGYTPEELKGKSISDITPERWHEQDKNRSWQQVHDRGYSDLMEKEYVTASCEVIPVEIRSYIHLNDAGQPEGRWAVVRNISERKKAEKKEQLEASEKRLHAVLAATGEGVWDWHIQSGQVYHSHRWFEIFGLKDDEGSPDLAEFENLIVAEDRPAALARLSNSLTGKGAYRSQHRMLRGNGRVIWVQDRGDVIERAEDGTPLRMVGSISDITAYKESELAILKAKSEAERANVELVTALDRLQQTQRELVRSEKLASLGSLVAGISHELNTPIGNAVMVASTLSGTQKKFMSLVQSGLTRSDLNAFLSSVGEIADILDRNLHRAAELVSSFKQLAVDQSSYQRRAFGLHEVINEVILAMGPAIRKTQHKVQSSAPADLRLDSYPGPLGQILINLINNSLIHAFKDTESGLISIEAQAENEHWVRLTVIDNGCGISEDDQKRIFDPFFTTRLGQGGSGLGLHIVFNLVVDLLGGQIDVSSKLGQESVFTLRIPRSAPAKASR